MGIEESGVLRARNLLAFLALLALPGIVSAQGKIYGTLTCQPAAEQRSAPAAGKLGPAPATPRTNCTWSEPLVIAGFSAKDAPQTGQSQETAYLVHMSNGDQVTLRFSNGDSPRAAGASRTLQGTWTLADGTGALNGITGHGTYSGLPRAAGGTSYDIEGISELPASAPPVAPQHNPPPD